MTHIDLVNITTINGQPPAGGGPGGGNPPGGITGEIQFNSGGLFAASSSLFWDIANLRLGIGTFTPRIDLDVTGSINSNNCFLVNMVPFACVDGTGIKLQNVTNINGGPAGPSCVFQTPYLCDHNAANYHISSLGSIGIGTVAVIPGNDPKIDIVCGPVARETGLRITANNTGDSARIQLRSVNGRSAWVDYSQSDSANIGIMGIYTGGIIQMKVNSQSNPLVQLGGPLGEQRVGINNQVAPVYELDVVGSTRTTSCFYIGTAAPLVSLCNDGTGKLLVNGSPISSVLGNIVAGTCITVTPSGSNVIINSNVACIQSPWVTNIDAGNHSLTNVTTINGQPIGPAPPVSSVQWNNSGVFGGSANLIWDNANVRLGIGGAPTYTLDVGGQSRITSPADTALILANSDGHFATIGVESSTGQIPGSLIARNSSGNYMWWADPTGNINIANSVYASNIYIIGAYFGPNKVSDMPMLFCRPDADPGTQQNVETVMFWFASGGAIVVSFRDGAGNIHRGTIPTT